MDALSAGAGASEGMDTFLKRMLLEEQQQRLAEAQQETSRHNIESERLQGNSLASLDADRKAREAENERKGQETADNKADTLAIRRVSLRPIGSSVTKEEMQDETTKHGIPSALYGDWQPGSMGKSTEQGEVGPNKEGMPWQGTQDQITAATKARNTGRHGDDKGVVHDTENGLVRIYADGTSEPVTDNEGKVLHGFHQPDRVLIQSGDGYMRRPDAAKKLAGGENVPLATTSSTRTMEEGARMLEPHIKRLEQVGDQLDKEGLFGPMMSRIRHAAESAGTLEEFSAAMAADPELSQDRRIGRFATSLGLLATGAGRVHGGARGGGSAQMLSHFKQLLADSTSYNMFLGRLDSLEEYMSGYAAGPGSPQSTLNGAGWEFHG
jgi:hypothetical protein